MASLQLSGSRRPNPPHMRRLSSISGSPRRLQRELQALTAASSAAAPVPATGAASAASNAAEAKRLEMALLAVPNTGLANEPAESSRKPAAIPG